MATGATLGLDFSKALQNAEKLDKKISDMVSNASKLEQTMTNAFKSGGLPSIIDRLQSSLKDIGETKVNLKFDKKNIEEYFDFLNKIVTSIQTISKNGQIEMFNTKNTYNASNDFLALNENLSNVKAKIDEIKKAYNDLNAITESGKKYANRKDVTNLTGIEFPKTKKTGVDVGDNTKAARMWEEATKKQLELLMRRAIEEEAIANKSLQWAKMTEDQKIQYVQKRLNESLQAEKKHANEVQGEYKKLATDIIKIYDQIDKTEKSIAKGEKAGADVSKEKNNLSTLETLFKEKYARIQKIEQESGNYVVKQIEDFWVKISERDRKGLEDRIKQANASKQAYVQTWRGAMFISKNANSIEGERKAIDALIYARDNLSKSTANYDKIVEQLNERIQKHRISVEQLTTAEKNEQTLQPTIRNEYTRLLVELDKLADAKRRLQSTDAFKGNDAETKKMYDDIVAREQDVQNRIAQIRKNAQGLLDETERKHAAERANNSIAELERVERKRQELANLYTGITPQNAKNYVQHGHGDSLIANEKAEIARLVEQKYLLDKTDKDYINTIAQLDRQIAEHTRNIQNLTNAQREQHDEEQKKRETYSGALQFADQAKSLNDVKLAIEALDTARRKEDVRSKAGMQRFNELTEKLKTLKKNYDTLLETVSRNSRGLLDITGQLSRRLAGLFGVQSLIRYSRALINITGEFELQRRSLTSIIGSQREANRIWAQTTQLALKSPYQVKELVTYTKQLAAYRVESEKIHDTTKRLADVSAGLGVDMSRLILAYGQVKAANYLRGTELRQFSEAGVNMLDELAKYFSEIENRAVSVADVFDRVSKRGVSFADVDEVFNRITSASGAFYKMQEKQSETLKGMVSNLRDSIDIMLNDVGKSQMGVLKWSVGFVKGLIDNWKEWSSVLEGIATGFLTIKMYSLLASTSIVRTAAALYGMNVAGRNSVTLLQLLRVGFAKLGKSLSKFFKTLTLNPYIVGLTVLAATIAKLSLTIMSHNNNIDAINKGYKEFKERINELHSAFASAKFTKNVKKQEEALKSIAELANREYGMNIKVNLDANEEELSKQFNEIKDKLNAVTAFSNVFQQEFEKAGWWKVTGDIDKDFKQLNSAYTNLSSNLISRKDGIISSIQEIMDAGTELPQSVEKLYKALLTPPQNASDIEIFEYFQDAFNQFYEELDKELHDARRGKRREGELNWVYEILGKSRLTKNYWDGLLGDYNEAIKKAESEFNMFASRIEGELTGLTKEEKKIRLTAAINETSSKKEWGDYVEWCVKKWSEQKFEVKFDTKEKTIKELQKWQDTYNSKFGDNIITPNVNESYAGFKKITDAATKQKEVVERLQGEWASYNDTITKIEKIGVEKATGAGGAYEGYDYKKLKAEKTEIEKQLDWFGAPYQKQKKNNEQYYSDLVSIIKKVQQEYLDLVKVMSSAEAETYAMSNNAEAFNRILQHIPELKDKITLEGMDVTKSNSALAFVEDIIDKLPKKAEKAKIKLEALKGELELEQKKKDSEKASQNIIDSIDKQIGQYETTLELKELDIPAEWAKKFFGLDSMDLKDVIKNTKAEIAKVILQGGNENRLKELQDRLKKEEELERKSQEERLKTYLGYARESVGERAKIKLEEVKKLREIEETFGDSPENKVVKDKAIEAVKKETQEQLAKFDWEEFKGSDTFIKLFSDLDNASSALIEHSLEKLQEFKEQWKNMKLENVKEIVTKINELEQQLIDASNPFKEARKNRRDISKAERDAIFVSDEAIKQKEKDNYESAFQLEAQHWEEQKAQWEQEVAQLETVLRLKEEGKTLDQVRGQLTAEEIALYGKATPVLRSNLTYAESMVHASEKNATTNQDNADNYGKQRKLINKQADALQQCNKMANDLYDSTSDLVDILGAGDGPGKIFADMAMDMSSAVLNTIALQMQLTGAKTAADAFAASMNSAMGVIGWIVMAVNLVTQALSAVFQAQDKALQEQIENEQENIQRLEHELKKLEKAIESAFSSASLNNATREAQTNLDKQISSYQNMINAEEQRKKADQGQIDEWKRTIEDLQEEREQLKRDLVEQMGGTYDVWGQAEEFANAWLDSFKETGNGLKGLQESFNEFFKNIVIQQAVSQGMGRITKNLTDYINTALEDSIFDELEQKHVQNLSDIALKEGNLFMQQLFGDNGLFKDWITDSTNLSGLSQGIQGVTEETAQIIEAYLNSIRFMIADNNSMWKRYIDIQLSDTDETANPILSELKAHTTLITEIRNMFSSVIQNGKETPLGGQFLKVVMG